MSSKFLARNIVGDFAAAKYTRAAGGRSVLKVVACMLGRGDIEALHRTIERQGRQIKVIQGYAPRKRRH